MAKRYYWLKLKADFFNDKNIKYIRRLPDGDKILIVYLRLQLLSLKLEGTIQYEKILPSCSEEIALDLDESIELIEQTIDILTRLKLVEIMEDNSLYLNAVAESIGSESDSAERVRKHREKVRNDTASQVNTDEYISENEKPWV